MEGALPAGTAPSAYLSQERGMLHLEHYICLLMVTSRSLIFKLPAELRKAVRVPPWQYLALATQRRNQTSLSVRRIHSEVLEFVYKEILVFGLVFGLLGSFQTFSHLIIRVAGSIETPHVLSPDSPTMPLKWTSP
jgi:hypothetical protein